MKGELNISPMLNTANNENTSNDKRDSLYVEDKSATIFDQKWGLSFKFPVLEESSELVIALEDIRVK